jgi:dynein heavy chain
MYYIFIIIILALVDDPNYMIAPIEIYKLPFEISTHGEYIDYVKTLPLNSEPSIFGFHSNADITKDINETQLLFDSLLLCSQTATGGGKGQSLEETLDLLATNILADFPLPFNEEDAMKKYPVNYNESMNTVFTQELGRYNILIKVI